MFKHISIKSIGKEKRRQGGKERVGGLLGMSVISLMAFCSSQLNNKLCITISTSIKTLAVRNDDWLRDPCRFAWGQNNCPSLLLKLFSLS